MPDLIFSPRRARACVELAARQGWDIGRLLEEEGVRPERVARGGYRISSDQASSVVRALWLITSDELMGLGSVPVPLGTLRIVGFAVSGSRDLAAALRRYLEIAKAVPGYPPVVVNAGAQEVKVSLQFAAAEPADQLVVDTVLAAGHRFISWAIGRHLELRRVELPYPQPPVNKYCDPCGDYEALFGAPVTFMAAAAAIVFDIEMLSAPLTRTEAELEEFLRSAPEGLLLRDTSAIAARVRRLMAEECLGGAGWMSGDELASRLAMSPQTLRRRLHDEQTSIRKIREGLLRDEAVASLVRGETVAALSHRLGFSEPSAFTRAFRRWTGSNPGSYLPRGQR